MGLKIKYRFTFEGTKEDLLVTLKMFRDELIKVGAMVTPIWEVTGKDRNEKSWKLMYPDNPNVAMWWFYGLTNNGKGISDGVGFVIGTPKGCDNVTIALGRMKKKSSSWASCYCETKTQYAEDFIKSHEFVCAILKVTRDYLNLDYIDDYGDYYGKWDKEVLAKKLEYWDDQVHRVAEAMRKGGADVKCALDEMMEKHVQDDDTT